MYARAGVTYILLRPDRVFHPTRPSPTEQALSAGPGDLPMETPYRHA